MGTTFTPTSAIQATKNVQYYEQTAFGTYTYAAALKQIGLVSKIQHSLTQQHKETRIVGSRKLYDDRAQLMEGTVDLTYELVNVGTEFPNYAMKDPGTKGSDKPLALVETRKINGTEMYRVYEDCLTDKISFAIEKDIVVTQNMVFSNLTDWMNIAALRTLMGLAGTTDPQWAAALSGSSWNHLDSAQNNTGSPLTVAGAEFFNLKLTVDVNNNITKLLPGGWSKYYYSSPMNKAVSGTYTTWTSDGLIMEDHVRNFDSCAITYKIKNATPVVNLSVTGAHFTAESDSIEGGSNDFSTLDLPFTASDATLTDYP